MASFVTESKMAQSILSEPLLSMTDIDAVIEHQAIPATPSYAELRQFVAQQRKQQQKSYTEDKEVCRIFAEDLDRYRVVSFDIFDTLLVRYVDHPINVFFFLQNEPIFKKFAFRAPVHQLRIEAENLSRQMLHKAIGSSEVNLSEIYAVFCKKNDISLDYVDSFVAAEENVERKLCVINPFFVDLYSRAVQAGKRVIVATDMYLRKPFLLALLQEKGIAVSSEDLFVSSDLRVSKQSGGMFQKIFEALKVEPEAILHIGDHPISDYKKPLEMGIPSILHPHKASSNQVNGCHSDDVLTLQSYLRGMIRVSRHTNEITSDFWSWLGYRAFGPLVTGFCCWLKERFRADSIERAWFLLRDGELPSRVYNVLYPEATGTIVGTLPSSRRAFVFPTLEIAPQFAVPNLICCIKPLPVRSYLERLNVPADDFEQEFLNCGFLSSNEMVDGRIDHQKLFALLNQPRVLSAVKERSRHERNLIERFFAQEGLCGRQKIALIDLGWNGTIQKAAHYLLEQKVNPLHLKGYYVATKSSFSCNETPGMQHDGYLVYKGNPSNVDQLITSCYVFMEIVFSSLSGSLACFEESGEKVRGIFQESDKSAEQSSILQRIHEGVLLFAQEFREAQKQYGFGTIPPLVAAEEIFRLFSRPTAEEAEKIGALAHSENYGMTTHRYVAKFQPSLDPQSVLNDLHSAYWRAGLVGQDNEQAMILRSLLWLMESAAN